ncbi:MAG: CDP-alcohol phosphatidyltransferase family protein [Eubacteriales bacterium]|jgi:cardiolipin synthase|nr:CDP-alcohol phosphatidyltransferase family protein [Eubacteriales bacterium]MDD3504912.1 CDP-alcohol phosphatidyltransferase family protein [Eubacteriales bacterium]
MQGNNMKLANSNGNHSATDTISVTATGYSNRKYLTVPNFLSISRAAFLPILFYFIAVDRPGLFLIGYLLLGATDFFDGIIARRFNQKSEIGKTLDSVADIFYYLSTAWFIQALYPEYLAPNSLLLKIFFIAFGLSFVVSAIKCHKPILMHTWILKFNAVLVYSLMFFSYFFNTTYMISALLIIYVIGFAEEIYIFIRYGDVDPDTPYFWKIIEREPAIKE